MAENSVQKIRDFLTDKVASQVILAMEGGTEKKADRLIQQVINSARTDTRVAGCSHASIGQVAVQLATLGFELADGEVYLIPRGKNLTMEIGYKGMIGALYRGAVIESITAGVLHEGDEWDCDRGSQAFVRHKPAMGAKRGEVTDYYALAILEGSGRTLWESMTVAEVKDIQAMAPGGKSAAWKNHFDEMAKKTVLRRLMKFLPRKKGSQLLGSVEEHDNMAYRDESDQAQTIISAVTQEEGTNGNGN